MLEKITDQLLAWYAGNRRRLPWRESRDPYRIWISEIMLQQTRVEAVRSYYERFMARLPDAAAVAACPEDELLKLWEGLGYYNRVRNIQKTAVLLVRQYGGRLPADWEALKALPGIGSYTAGAVASIAYGICAPAVDGNVLRIWARIEEDGSDILKASTKTRVERYLQEIMPKDAPGAYNQALMDLGAMVCLPNGKPDCAHCPAADVCLARRHGTAQDYPVKKKAKARRVERRTILVARDGYQVALRKRPRGGLLGGLYEPPNLEGHLTEKEVCAWIADCGLSAREVRRLEASRHVFSHVEWEMEAFLITLDGPAHDAEAGFFFAPMAELERRYPVPSAFHAYLPYMTEKI